MTRSSRIGPTRASRAHAIALRLAADPPVRSVPLAVGGNPTHAANQAMISSSSCVGPEPSCQEPA